LNPGIFRSFVRKFAQSPQLGALPGKFLTQRVIVTVRGEDGRPVGNARVAIRGDAGGAPVELITRSDGKVVLVPAWDQVTADRHLTGPVRPPDGSRPVAHPVPANATRWEVTLPSVRPRPPRGLDLTLVIDTTGSMGDELKYLQAEVKSIVAAVHARFPQVSQR